MSLILSIPTLESSYFYPLLWISAPSHLSLFYSKKGCQSPQCSYLSDPRDCLPSLCDLGHLGRTTVC